MDIVQIDVTNRCHLSCTACTRLIAHQPKKWDMDLETFEKAVKSMEGWYEPGKVLGVIAGEPTLHPQFAELSRKFQELWGPKEDTGNGREPITDRNAYARERLFDRRNGRGLWTSLGARYYEHYETIQDVYSHHNQNDHTAGGKHQANMIDRKTLCAALGITDDEWKEYRSNCPIQNQWSATITPWGAYACEMMAHIDILLNDGKRAWPIEPGWWKRTPEEFGEQLDICEHCSLCLPAPSRVDSVERDIISEPNRIALQMAGSPAVKKGNFDIYDPVKHLEQRDIHGRKDHYIAESGCRVSPDNRSMMPKKLSAVVVCVGRAEHLRKTLVHNAAQVDELVVIMGPREGISFVSSLQVEEALNVIADGKVKVITSDRCFTSDHAFNKGAMLNDGLAFLKTDADWVVLTDADVFLNPNLREFVRAHALNPGVLYGTERYHLEPDGPKLDDPLGLNTEPNGYFQLFNRRALAIRDKWPAVMSEEFCSAGGIDSWFLQQFPKDKRRMIPELCVGHIPHGPYGAGWNGDRKGECWRQGGVITTQYGLTWFVQPKGKPTRFKLTDTKYGKSVVCELQANGQFPIGAVTIQGERIVLGGTDVGNHHVHVAYWGE